jgi:outer membrane protein assembly factor BamB
MVFLTGSQRPGKVPWTAGLLMGCFLALTGTEYWINLEHQVQNDAEVERAGNAELGRDGQALGDPDDWPQWRGPHRDGSAPGKGLLTRWPEDGLPVLWKKKGGPGASSLAVAAGRVITLFQEYDDEVVACWDAESGKENWRFSYESRFTKEVLGPRSTPTIDGDRVYTVGARGRLCCLNVKTGKEVWHKDFMSDFDAPLPQWGFSFSPLVEGDLLLTSPGGPGGKSLIAFDKMTGKVRWKNLDDPAGYSSPVISTAVDLPVLSASTLGLMAAPFGQGPFLAAPALLPGSATAANVRQAVFLTGTRLVGLDPKTGKLSWSFDWPTPNFANVATPLVRGDYIFISSGYSMGCALLRIHRDGEKLDVELVYKNNLMRNHYASCVFYKDYLYGFDEGYLTCLSFRKGKKRMWKEGKFGRGNLLLVGEHLLVLGKNGKMALVEPTPAGYRELALCSVSDNPCWSMPAFAHGRLYLRDDEQVLCLGAR